MTGLEDIMPAPFLAAFAVGAAALIVIALAVQVRAWRQRRALRLAEADEWVTVRSAHAPSGRFVDLLDD